MNDRLKLPLVIAAGVIAVSSASILIKYALAEHIPPLVIAACRLGLASLLLAPFEWGPARTELPKLSKIEIFLTLLSGAFLALHFAFWISSFDYTSVMSSVVLVATNPLFVALASLFLLRERVPRSTWAGILIATIGGAVVGLADFGAGTGSLSGDLLALFGAVAASAYVLLGRRLRVKLSLLAYIGLVYSVAAIFLLSLALVSGASFAGYSALGYLILVLVALVPQLIGHTAFNYSLKYLPAAMVALILLAEPIGATILAIPLFGEIPTPIKLLGGVLVLAGIFVASRRGEEPAAAPLSVAEE